MAEVAPLITAHTHARRAAEETQQIHWREAADEHQHAATDFARAARVTNDPEALRILKLLEEQHKKLSRIIRVQDVSDQAERNGDESKDGDKASVPQDGAAGTAPQKSTPASKTKSTPSALATTRIGSHARDSSPSLARDIASRRGIPQPGRGQESAAMQARARQLSPESHRGVRVGAAPKIARSMVDSQASLPSARKSKKQEDDDGFTKFYSSVTNGTMSKLSSVLAYAGLPLMGDEKPDQAAKQSTPRGTVRAGNEHDVKKIFSKAALDAIEEAHRQRGTLGHGFGPTESFYVVPPPGGQESYSPVAKGAHLSSVGEEDDDAFVDAREVPGPTSPRHSVPSGQKRGSFGNPRTSEELELENTTLKHTLEQLAGRLANFEAHAQDASMAALTQSMASLRLPAGAPDSALLERLRQLEQQVEKHTEDKEKLETYAASQEKALKKWQVRYDKLKAGAKEKMAKKEKAEKGYDDPGTPDIA